LYPKRIDGLVVVVFSANSRSYRQWESLGMGVAGLGTTGVQGIVWGMGGRTGLRLEEDSH